MKVLPSPSVPGANMCHWFWTSPKLLIQQCLAPDWEAHKRGEAETRSKIVPWSYIQQSLLPPAKQAQQQVLCKASRMQCVKLRDNLARQVQASRPTQLPSLCTAARIGRQQQLLHIPWFKQTLQGSADGLNNKPLCLMRVRQRAQQPCSRPGCLLRQEKPAGKRQKQPKDRKTPQASVSTQNPAVQKQHICWETHRQARKLAGQPSNLQCFRRPARCLA